MIMTIWIEVMGCIAGVLTSVAYFPQIYKLIKSKQALGISVPTYLCSFFGCLIWFAYGVIIHSIALILFNLLNIVTSLIVIYLTKKFTESQPFENHIHQTQL